MHVELHLPYGTALEAPFAGTLRQDADGLRSVQGGEHEPACVGRENAAGARVRRWYKGKYVGEVHGTAEGAIVPRRPGTAAVLHASPGGGLAGPVSFAGGLAGPGL